MKKRVLSILLAIVLMLSSMPLALADSTNNYKIDWLVQNGIVKGRNGGDLALQKNITRAEFARMVLASTGELEAAEAYAGASTFKDISSDHWAQKIIAYATLKGYLAGYTDGTFRPDAFIKQVECIAILVRLSPNYVEPQIKPAYWAQAYIDYAKTSGLLHGIDSTKNLEKFAVRQTAFELTYNEVQVKTTAKLNEEQEARKFLEEETARKEAEAIEEAKKEEAKKEEARKEEARKEARAREERERRDRYEIPERYPRVVEYRINFYANGGLGYMSSDSFVGEGYYTLPLCSYTAPTGFHFDGWDVNGVKYREGKSVYVDRDIYASATWAKNETEPVPPTPTPTKPAAPKNLVSTAPTVAGNDGKITGVNNTMEYAKDADFSEAKAITGTEITGLEAGTYYVRVKANGTIPAGVATEVVVPAYVAPVTVTSIEVKSKNHKKEYKIGEEIDLTNLTILVKTSDNKEKTVTVTKEMVSGFKTDKVYESLEIIITYKGQTTKYTVKVVKKDGPSAPTGLEGVEPTAKDNNDGKITGVDSTMEYAKDEAFTSPVAITGDTIENLEAGTYYVRVKATEKIEAGAAAKVEVPAYVAPIEVLSIEVNSDNHKTEYKVGDSLDLSNLKIKVKKSNDTEEIIEVKKDMVSGFKTDKVYESIEITITYKEKTAKYTIKVVKKDGPVAPTGLEGVAPTSTENNDGKITGVDSTMEYAKDEAFTSPVAITGDTIENLEAGTYYVRVKATEKIEAGAAAKVEVPAYVAPIEVLSIEVNSDNHKTEYKVGDSLDLSNLKIKVKKSNDTEEIIEVKKDMVSGFKTDKIYESLEITITYKDKTAKYTIKVVKKDGPEAPKGLKGVAPTSAANNDGKITGVDSTMEYTKNVDFSDPEAITDNEVTGLVPGEYYVRIKETETTNAGEAVKVLVPKYNEPVYKIKTIEPKHGSFKFKVNGSFVTEARAGELVTIECEPESGYELAIINVTIKLDETHVGLVNVDEGLTSGTFKMPARDVEVKAAFSIINSTIKEEVYNKLLKFGTKKEPNYDNPSFDVNIPTGKTNDEIIAEVNAGCKKYDEWRKGKYLQAISSGTNYETNFRYAGSVVDGKIIGNIVSCEIIIRNSYLHNKEQEATINKYVDDFIKDNITNGMSVYDKVKAVHDYIIKNAAYIARINNDCGLTLPSYTPKNNSSHSPYAIVSEKLGVCQAYAGLFQKFMDKLNIESYYVTGRVKNKEGGAGELIGSGHAWNKVKIDGKYYNIDLTWDDPTDGGQPSTHQQGAISGLENYDYFLKSDEFFNESRIADGFTDLVAIDYQDAPTGYLNNQN